MMFIHRRKLTWKARMRLAWRVLRGDDLYAEFLRRQARQFQGATSSTTAGLNITYKTLGGDR